MKRGIKSKVIGNFLILVLLAVIFFESILLRGIHEFFYSTVENALITRLDYSIDYYNKYYSSMALKDVILEDIDIFWNHTACQVQIFSPKGELLMDSIGVWSDNATPIDVKMAMDEGEGVSIETPFYTSSEVMAVSKAIEIDGETFLILRFITNLDSVNYTISSITKLVIGIGAATVILTFIIGYFLADSIVMPLKRLTLSAEKMAQGDMNPGFAIERNDEIGQLSHTLNYMAEELEKKEQIKNDFISSVSHELRTPLTAIKGWAVTLNDFSDEEMLKEGLDIIESESDRLTGMVEELLDFSSYVQGGISLNKKDIDINKLASRTIREIGPKADNFSVSLVSHIEGGLIIQADPKRLRQVLINILDNAIKFSYEGGMVHINTYDKGDNIEIEVLDEGIGMEEDELSRVKEKFYKGDSKYSHNGLGLSISDEIIKLHNGSLNLYSEKNKGTKAVITLPKEIEDD